ncbi:MAG: methyltransferase domain-containing protein [Saprospiraceae bacterium]|nr:methyltransferase domain-containing protein [Saprospiraceae bacterium]
MTSLTTTNHTHQDIIRYYEEASLDYANWSSNFNMHFGFCELGMNPFQLESLLERMNGEVLRRLSVSSTPAPYLLDLGCGLSATSRYMARQLPDANFLGVTITPWQVGYAHHLNQAAGLDGQIALLQADYQDLPLGDGGFDGAFSLESACYAEGNGKAALSQEVFRMLKPGAKWVVTDGFRKHSRPLPNWLDRIYRRNLECWALKEFADIQLFVHGLKDAGFVNIKVEDISWKVAPSFCHIPKTSLKFFWRRLWDKNQTPLTPERRNNVLAPLLGMAMGLSKRHFTYCIVTAQKPD